MDSTEPPIHEAFEAVARTSPERTCVVAPDRQLSYGEVDRLATELAARLQARGITSENEPVVGLLMEASLSAFISILAIWKAGGAYLPLDPNGPTKRASYMLRKAGVRIVLTNGSVKATKISALVTESGLASSAVIDCDDNAADKATFRPRTMSSTRLAYVFFTSGSTGTPKGVMVEHRQVWNCIRWMQRAFPLQVGDRVVQRTPLTFDPSVWEMFWPATLGASMFVVPPGKAANAAYLVKLLEHNESELTAMYVPASMVGAMRQVLASGKDRRRLRLPLLFIGAEAIHRSVIDTFFESFEGRIVNTYGPTECTINNTYYEILRHVARSPVPIGRPVDHNEIHVVSTDGVPVAAGQVGEILIGGRSVARGYIDDPEKTAQAFVRTTFADGVVYRTGDLGRLADDGNIEFVGRLDDQIKIRGYRIEPAEVEVALCKHADVVHAVVLAREVEDGSAAGKALKLVAYYTARQGISELDLRKHLSEFVAPHMIPTYFVHVEAFKLTEHGKIDRRELHLPEHRGPAS
jgi:amino acid adenylation domain-containing protein